MNNETFNTAVASFRENTAALLKREHTSAKDEAKIAKAFGAMLANASSMDTLAALLSVELGALAFDTVKKNAKGEESNASTPGAASAYRRVKMVITRAMKAANYAVTFKANDSEARAQRLVLVTIAEAGAEGETAKGKGDASAANQANMASDAVKEPGTEDYQLGAGDILEHALKLTSDGRKALILALLDGMRAEDIKVVYQATKSALKVEPAKVATTA